MAKSRRTRALAAALVAYAVGTCVAVMRGYRFGREVVVRCRQGHLFVTTWIPGASLKAIRLGWWRFQRCPVGPHWDLVRQVRESDLSPDGLSEAKQLHDTKIP